MSKANNKRVKLELYAKCGKICMYSMHKFSKKKLHLHHYPPYRETRHTVYEESYLISDRLHQKLHKLERQDYDAYLEMMKKIKQNKKVLERKRKWIDTNQR